MNEQDIKDYLRENSNTRQAKLDVYHARLAERFAEEDSQ